jgi:ComG operon protein 7
MFLRRLGILKNQTGVVFPYLLMLLLLICLIVENRIREYVSFRNFIIETESKLVSEHLLFMASHESSHFKNIHSGNVGYWIYPGGEVFFEVQSITQDHVQVLITATTNSGGNAHAQFEYDMLEEKIISWSE